MSAFMVTDDHITALLHVAMNGATDAENGMRGSTLYWGNPTKALRRNDDSGATAVGQMLLRENLRSYNYRYDEFGGDEQVENYAYKHRAEDRLSGVAALKALDCYEYQACECPDWHDSEAYKFCVALRDLICSHLRGYNDAKWAI